MNAENALNVRQSRAVAGTFCTLTKPCSDWEKMACLTLSWGPGANFHSEFPNWSGQLDYPVKLCDENCSN